MAAGALCFWPWFSTLLIGDATTGCILYRVRMRSGEEFVLAFIHSVNRRPVFDTLRVADDHLVIVGSRFDSFGAGMPESSGPDGTLSIAPDGWLVYRVERPTPEIVVRVGRVAEHTLHIKGRSIGLAQLAQPGTALRFFVDKCSLVDLVKIRNIPWTQRE